MQQIYFRNWEWLSEISKSIFTGGKVLKVEIMDCEKENKPDFNRDKLRELYYLLMKQ